MSKKNSKVVEDGKFLTKKELATMEELVAREQTKQLQIKVLDQNNELLLAKKKQLQTEAAMLDKDIRIAELEKGHILNTFGPDRAAHRDFLEALQAKYKLKDLNFGYDHISGKIIEDD